MKTLSYHLASTFTILAAGLLLGTSADAAISGINQSNTNAQFNFNDTNSMNSSSASGTTLYTTNQGVWQGNPLGLSVTDPVTADLASFIIRAFSWNFPQPATPYGFDMIDFKTMQNPTGSGFAEAQLTFRIQYQLDGGGLTIPTLFVPQYVVDGTVQTGGFAMVVGQVDYISGALGLMDTYNYGYFNNTPGAFVNQPLVGTPVLSATSFVLPANDTFTIDGYFKTTVDPATLTISTVPEPGVATLAMVALGMLAGRRWRKLE